MRAALFCFAVLSFGCSTARAENTADRVRKAIERSTLDQPGTIPFHLKATIAPTFERDKNSGQTGGIEIWWASPSQWKREVRSPEFHQIEVLNKGREWQKNDGNYFPEWLRDIAIALIQPVPPPLDEILEGVKTAEVRKLTFRTNSGGLIQMTHIGWVKDAGTAQVHNIQRSTIALDSKTGLLLYGSGFGWNGEFYDYRNFHGRTVAHRVNSGAAAATQVTATITTLEDPGQKKIVAHTVKWVAAGGDNNHNHP